MYMRRAVCGLSTLRSSTECRHEQRVRVAVDCSLGHHMTNNRELKSLATQIKELYFTNLGAPKPFQLYLTGLETGSRIHNALNTHIHNFSTFKLEIMEERHDSVFNPPDIVYLTPDSDHDLETLDRSKVYVVGGLVDLSGNRNLTLHRARMAGLRTARLPIRKFMELLPSSHMPKIDLPINIVISMLLDVHCGSDWPSVLNVHIPKRKGLRLKSTATAAINTTTIYS